MGTQPPPPKGGRAPSPIFGPFLLWPNGWMHQDTTWYIARPQPMGLRVRWGPSPLSLKRGRSPLSNFRPVSILAKRLDGSRWHLAWRWALVQATLCYMGKPSSPPPKGHRAPQFSAHFCCRQTAECIKMPLGMKIGLSPGDFVLGGDPASPPLKRHSAPNFRPMSVVAK